MFNRSWRTFWNVAGLEPESPGCGLVSADLLVVTPQPAVLFLIRPDTHMRSWNSKISDPTKHQNNYSRKYDCNLLRPVREIEGRVRVPVPYIKSLKSPLSRGRLSGIPPRSHCRLRNISLKRTVSFIGSERFTGAMNTLLPKIYRYLKKIYRKSEETRHLGDPKIGSKNYRLIFLGIRSL